MILEAFGTARGSCVVQVVLWFEARRSREVVSCGCSARARAGPGTSTPSPLALALRSRGHDVQWATAADGGALVAAMGFEWSAAGMTTADRRDAAAEELVHIMQLPMAHRRGPLFAAFFARAAGPVMQRDLDSILDRVRPDEVVREVAELGVAPRAAARGMPLVTAAFSGVLAEAARRDVMADPVRSGTPKVSTIRHGTTSTVRCTSIRSRRHSVSSRTRRSFVPLGDWCSTS